MIDNNYEINDVFTPRNEEVNLNIYVPRRELEKRLLRSVTSNIHSVLLGDSGNGKSWLYKKVLAENDIPYRIANCSNAARFDSLTEEICRVLIEDGDATKTSYTEGSSAEISAVVAKGGLKHEGQFIISQPDLLLKAFNSFPKSDSGKRKILVLDNLEFIHTSNVLLQELANIIILLDDPRYAKSKINFLIVGLPTDMFDYFGRKQNLESVSNRMEELPRVGALPEPAVFQIIYRGFNELLNASLPIHVVKNISRHVKYVTLGIAQKVHEYCKELAFLLEDNDWQYKDNMLMHADVEWLKSGLHKSKQIMLRNLSKRNHKHSRINQVIFMIGQQNLHSFDSKIVEQGLRKYFGKTLVGKNHFNINKILRDLTKTNAPIIAHDKVTKEYYVKDPRLIMCIRLLLRRDNDTQVLNKNYLLRK